MQYVGIYTQQVRNNMRSMLLLCAFPCILMGMLWLFLTALSFINNSHEVLVTEGNQYYYTTQNFVEWNEVTQQFITYAPIVVCIVGVWFAIAYFLNSSMVRSATGARPLERRENPRVYNIVENLCMAGNMDMPKINVIDDPMLNAFASGIDKDSYTVTVTTGICDRLNDEELAGVIGHELTHIKNRDTRLLIVSIIFVGIMSTLLNITLRLMWNNLVYGGGRRRSNNGKNGGASIIIVFAVGFAVAVIGYIFTLMTRFAISRKREYMADAGGAELCGNPLALASALRKISGNPALQQTERQDVAQLFIYHESKLAGEGITTWISSLFATHPSIESRIKYLEQF